MGVANIASALFGGLPATGAIARTATNVRAGAQTPVAGMVHAVFLLVFMLLAGRSIAFVPMATLAAVLLMVAWGMSEAGRVRALLRTDPGERALLIAHLLPHHHRRSHRRDRGRRHAGGPALHAADERACGARPCRPGRGSRARAALPPGVEVLRFTGPIFFGVASELIDALRRVGQSPSAIVLRMEDGALYRRDRRQCDETFVRQAKAAAPKSGSAVCSASRSTSCADDPAFAGARRARPMRGRCED